MDFLCSYITVNILKQYTSMDNAELTNESPCTVYTIYISTDHR